MKELTLALLMWIGSHTPLAYEDTPLPSVATASQKELTVIRYRGDVPEGFEMDTGSTVGVYLFEERKIYLWENYDFTTVEGKAALVHELVHFLQYEHGLHETADCTAQLELAAYSAEAEYLKQHGMKPKFSGMDIVLASMCWDA
jgi:hypothetical protein